MHVQFEGQGSSALHRPICIAHGYSSTPLFGDHREPEGLSFARLRSRAEGTL
jgi:hypothetical protein